MGEEKHGEAKPEEQKELTDEQIRQIVGDTRAKLCAVELMEILKKYNCVYNPTLHMTNQGYYIEVKIIGLAYPFPIPGNFVNETVN